MPVSIAFAGLVALAGALGAEAAWAHPARIILLRHGEKKNSAELCDVGNLRAQALSTQYLGKGAPGNDAIFGNGRTPDAFFAVTAHTRETAAPSAQSWGKQLTLFPVPPKDPNEDADLDAQTQKAAAALNSAEYDGKTVVVVWEHKHIAKKDLNHDGSTFWSLLKLGEIPNASVPKSWEGVNYDFFWIIDYLGSQASQWLRRSMPLPVTRRSPTTHGARTWTRPGFQNSIGIANSSFAVNFHLFPQPFYLTD